MEQSLRVQGIIEISEKYPLRHRPNGGVKTAPAETAKVKARLKAAEEHDAGWAKKQKQAEEAEH